MNRGSWDEVECSLKKDLSIIFENINIYELSDYEKRKKIYEYLTEAVSYDYEKLEEIHRANLDHDLKVKRDLIDELLTAIFNKKGMCNAISQYYKLLLEMVGIKSYCVVCDDGTDVYHQLNIVLDKETNNYSFDDVTSVIVNRGTIDEFFDYDLYNAHNHIQGLRKLRNGLDWLIIPNELIYYYVGRDYLEKNDLKAFPTDKIVKCKKNKTI